MDNPMNNTPNTRPSSAGRQPVMPPRGPRPPMNSGPGQMAMTPKEIAGILRRHIWMIIVFVVLGTMIGGGSWYLCNRYIPQYTSSRPIDVDSPVISDPTKIGVPQPQKDIYYQFRSTKASLIKQQSMLEELLRQSAVRETQWFKKKAKVDSAGKLIGDQEKAIGKAYKDLEDNLGASAPRDNNYVLVSMRCGSAEDAQTIVNEMVHIFLAQQQELARKGLAGELAQLRKQRDDIQSTLNQIDNSLQSIRTGTRFARLNLGENQSFRDYMDDKLANLERQNSALDSEKGRLESVIATLEARANAEGFDERVQEQVERDPIAQSIRSDISRLEPQLDRRLARFGEDHRLVRETQAALKQMREALGKRQFEIGEIQRHSNLLVAEETMAAQVQQLTTVQQQLDIAYAEYRDIDLIRNDYSRKEQQRVEKRTALEDMNTLIEKKTTQHDDPKLSKLSSPYSATKPRGKSFPRKTMFIPGGFMLGMLLGVGLAFLVELMNDLLRTPSDVMRHLKVPLVGMICHSDDDKDIESVDLYHVVRQAPYSIISECYRQLRTNLKLSGTGGAAHKTLLITSGQSEDGKTTVAVNLASSLLTEERRVLLIDTNFRRPSINRLFPHSGENGTLIESSGFALSNYLSGQCAGVDQIIRDSGIEGLSVIDSGPLPANPAELFSSERMKGLLEYCKSNFDYVILDGPATLVSDSKTLAAQADGTIVVLNASQTHRGQASRILREMREIHANVIGTVLMGVKTRKGGYFRENYRSYQQYQRVLVEQPA